MGLRTYVELVHFMSFLFAWNFIRKNFYTILTFTSDFLDRSSSFVTRSGLNVRLSGTIFADQILEVYCFYRFETRSCVNYSMSTNKRNLLRYIAMSFLNIWCLIYHRCYLFSYFYSHLVRFFVFFFTCLFIFFVVCFALYLWSPKVQLAIIFPSIIVLAALICTDNHSLKTKRDNSHLINFNFDSFFILHLYLTHYATIS